MISKIISIGGVLFFSCLCLQHPFSSVSFAEERNAEPSNGSESESPAECELPPSPLADVTVSISPPRLESTTPSPEPLLSEDSENGFDLEILPADQPRKEPEFDIPIVINARVEQFIQYFQTSGRKVFSNWLSRSGKYIPFMRSLLKEHGLPEDLVFMALIESGFSPYAYSRMKASGPWQFIYLTGKKYGLRVNWWVDERRDPEKSTIAAAKYLKDLYDIFECWYLAAAGYNAGEGKIANAVRRYKTEDFWELTKYRYLKRETKDYVPQMIAAALIAKDPEKYGFGGLEYQEPLQYEKVVVPEAVDLAVIAKACEISVEELKELNPELLRWCTPPDSPNYEIKIPWGKKELFLQNFEALQPVQKFQFKTHVVKKGDTLSTIAKSYRVDMQPLFEINRLNKKSRLSVGMHLLIPIPKQSAEKPRMPKPEEAVYTIRKGDSLWSIANEMGVNIGALSQWNNLHPDKALIPGDKLKIKPVHAVDSNGKRKEIVYVVKPGDTLADIAEKHRVSVAEIMTWNQLKNGDRIFPSDRLKLRVGQPKSSTPN
jgi:membrane-bound lytic murein transglycosylase D